MALTPKLSLVPSPHADQSATASLEALGDQELPDIRLNPGDRQFVRDLLAELEERLSVDSLMFLAGGAEHAARRKRAEESRRA